MTTERQAEWWLCCACCDDPIAEDGPKSACFFNGERDRHTWHCEECEPQEQEAAT